MIPIVSLSWLAYAYRCCLGSRWELTYKSKKQVQILSDQSCTVSSFRTCLQSRHMDSSNEKMEKTESNPKIAEYSEGEISNLDEGDIFLRDNNFTPAYVQELLADKDLNKRLVRKIDFILLPLLAGTYVLQYIDKSALEYSAVFDILKDTNTSLYQYSWLGSIFLLRLLVR